MKVKFDFGEKGKHDREGRVITAFFQTFTLVTAYQPNSGVETMQRLTYRVHEWDPDFFNYM